MKKDEDFSIDFSKLNLKSIRYEYLFLFLFLVLGFYLRTYHIDYPAVGYHNMKENEYIGAAKFMYKDGDYLHRKLFREGYSDIPYFEEYPQMPLIQWASVILWKIFGMQLWLPRLLMILASVGSIYAAYLLIFELSKSKYLALLSAFFMTILPLGVFFGRNIQPESPALLFLLLAMLYYTRWIERFDKKNALYFGLYLGIAGLFKYTFLIGLVPMFFIFPFARLKELAKKKKENLTSFLFGLSPIIIWSGLAPFLNKLESVGAGTLHRINLWRVFTAAYWQGSWGSFNNYIGDNFTWWYFWAAVFGVMLVAMTLKDKRMNTLSIAGLLLAGIARFADQGTSTFVLAFFAMFAIIVINAFLSIRHKKPFQTFVLFYAAAIIPYCMILSDYIVAHNYYQMPFLPLIALLSAYTLYTLGTLLKQIARLEIALYLPLALILLTTSSVTAHKDAMFNTQFFGLDVAGEYLKEVMPDGGRFVFFGHSQSVAVCVYAEHLCIMMDGNVSRLQAFEQKRGSQWIVIDDGAGMAEIQRSPEMAQYLEKNYEITALGILQTPQGGSLYTLILHKGGNFSFANISENPVAKRQQVIAKTQYELSNGKLDYFLLG